MTKPFDPQEMVARVAISERVTSLEDRLRASQERLQVLASHDGLTGLFNRQAILDHAAAEVIRSRRMDLPVSFVLLDVDHFKQINDAHGHLQGDLALHTIGEALAKNKHPYDWAGRWGGEEFLLVLPGAAPEEGGQIAERVRRSIASPEIPVPRKPVLQVTVSAGVAGINGRGDAEVDDLLLAADRELYRAKRQGRNQVCLAPHLPDATQGDRASA